MGKLKRIQDTISGKLPSYNSAFLKVRGLAFPLDVFLTGTVRFARKLGSLLPVWIPDNATTLSEAASTKNNKLLFSYMPSWVVPGSKLRLGQQVFAFVDDVIAGGVFLTENPTIELAAGASVELYGHPLEMAASYPGTPEAPVNIVIVASDYKIYPGDMLNIGAFDHEISATSGPVIRGDGRFQYQLTVIEGITSNLDLGRQDQAYLRAYPAYESQQLKTPTIPGTLISNIGPFLYDRVSGPFFTDLNVEEVDIVTVYDSSGAQLSTSKMAKNALIYNASISADAMLFWDKSEGSIQWDGNRQAFKAITSAAGLFHLHYQCEPNIPVGQVTFSWKINVEAEVDTTMIVELEPNINQVFNLVGGEKTSVEVLFPLDDLDIQHIHVLFNTEAVNPGKAVYIRSWETTTPTVGSISHATIAKVTGQFVWGSSGVFAKPYMLKLDYLKASADLFAKFNQGMIAS